MNKVAVISVLAIAAIQLAAVAEAQRINDPTHIPNRFQNKINHIRLQGMTQKSTTTDLVEEENKKGFESSGFNFSGDIKLLESNGCNINVGNSVSGGVGSSGDRDVIIAGDVINVCR